MDASTTINCRYRRLHLDTHTTGLVLFFIVREVTFIYFRFFVWQPAAQSLPSDTRYLTLTSACRRYVVAQPRVQKRIETMGCETTWLQCSYMDK